MVSIFSCRICVARRFSRVTCRTAKPWAIARYSVMESTPRSPEPITASIRAKALREPITPDLPGMFAEPERPAGALPQSVSHWKRQPAAALVAVGVLDVNAGVGVCSHVQRHDRRRITSINSLVVFLY